MGVDPLTNCLLYAELANGYRPELDVGSDDEDDEFCSVCGELNCMRDHCEDADYLELL